MKSGALAGLLASRGSLGSAGVAASAGGLIDFLMISGQAPQPTAGTRGLALAAAASPLATAAHHYRLLTPSPRPPPTPPHPPSINPPPFGLLAMCQNPLAPESCAAIRTGSFLVCLPRSPLTSLLPVSSSSAPPPPPQSTTPPPPLHLLFSASPHPPPPPPC